MANVVHLNAFQEERATVLANSGDGLAATLEAGEWPSPALLMYITETELDISSFWLQRSCLAMSTCVGLNLARQFCGGVSGFSSDFAHADIPFAL